MMMMMITTLKHTSHKWKEFCKRITNQRYYVGQIWTLRIR